MASIIRRTVVLCSKEPVWRYRINAKQKEYTRQWWWYTGFGCTRGTGTFFSACFLLQMNSRVFPQTQEEDPLFPDVLRRRINSILPDLALRSEGGLQERHLFHTLFTSAQLYIFPIWRLMKMAKNKICLL